MPTIMRPPVHQGKTYTVKLKNNPTSAGVAIAIVAWVPNHEHSVPRPRQVSVAAGGEAALTGEIPEADDARRMTVIVELDAGESGTLEVFEDGEFQFRERLTETTTFGMAVV